MTTALEFEAGTGDLRAPDSVLEALVRGAADGADLGPELREALQGAGAVVDGRPHPRLEAALAAIADPVVELWLERGARRGRGWVAREGSALQHPLPDGRGRLVAMSTGFVPYALARLNDLGPRPRAPGAPRVVLRAGALAETVASRAAAASGLEGAQREALEGILAGLREHWRVESHWRPADGALGGRSIEVMDTEDGLWLVVPDDPSVELWPTTPTTVFRALCEVLPYDHEVAR